MSQRMFASKALDGYLQGSLQLSWPSSLQAGKHCEPGFGQATGELPAKGAGDLQGKDAESYSRILFAWQEIPHWTRARS